MENHLFTEDFAKRFKKSYAYKMGGSQTIVLPNGQRFTFNDRQYYSGRGAKYNSSIRHDNRGDVIVTEAQVADAIKEELERAEKIKQLELEELAYNNRVEEARKNGIYGIAHYEYGDFIELSIQEKANNIFDATRLAATLKISIEDAELLKSNGKTYVFAESEDGNIYELYHPSLSCNSLSICVSIATPERIAEFNSQEWQSAPYAALLGQTSKTNHFVC